MTYRVETTTETYEDMDQWFGRRVQPLPDTVHVDLDEFEENVTRVARLQGYDSNVFLRKLLEYRRLHPEGQTLEIRQLADVEKNPHYKAKKRRKRDDEPTQFKMAVSNIATLYPALLDYYHVSYEKPDRREWPFDAAETPATMGEGLHRLDAIDNAVIQNLTGSRISFTFITHKPERYNTFAQATRHLFVPSEANMQNPSTPRRLTQTLLRANQSYIDIINDANYQNPCDVPFAGYKIPDPVEKAKVFRSPKFNNAAKKLALAWASEVQKTWSSDNLTMRPDCVSHRELGIVGNTPVGLQVTGRLDALSVHPNHLEYGFEIGELKTGNPCPKSALAQEVRVFEAETMLFLAELFIEQYILEGREIPRGGYVPVNVYDMANYWSYPNVNVAINYRYFNPRTGELVMFRHKFTPESRERFLRRLLVMGNAIQPHKEAMKNYYAQYCAIHL